MPVVQAGIHTLHHKAKEIAAGESPELLGECTQAGRMCEKTSGMFLMWQGGSFRRKTAWNVKIWYIDSKGHFEYIPRYEQLTSGRN